MTLLFPTITHSTCGRASHHIFSQDIQNWVTPGQETKQNPPIPQWTWMNTGNKIGCSSGENTQLVEENEAGFVWIYTQWHDRQFLLNRGHLSILPDGAEHFWPLKIRSSLNWVSCLFLSSLSGKKIVRFIMKCVEPQKNKIRLTIRWIIVSYNLNLSKLFFIYYL